MIKLIEFATGFLIGFFIASVLWGIAASIADAVGEIENRRKKK